uniref:Gelsolin-like domain-containing protein n=1 Tax=Electrophorus electricus TaxID=8005 RepID=A0A4W4FIF6_ELEEL
MVVHNEFTTAGKEPGLKIWRIEHMDLKPVPKNLYGNFYTGDAYLLLYTTSLPSYNIHMWLGEECSQDESGACAILCTQLDNYLGGYPVQYREVQCNESLTFQGYFKSGIKYQKGGIASGFRHVVTNDANVKYVLHVKGRRTIRATEVEFSWASFNQGDCFIIDLGKDIYQWHGKQCNMFEKTQALNMSRKIRDGERNGRATVHVVEEGEEPQALIDVRTSSCPIILPSIVIDTVETANKNKAALYMISDASGSMKTACVAQSNPFKQEMLIPEECFILDNGVDNNVFVWKDPGVASRGRNHTFQAISCDHLQIWRVEEGARVPVEPASYGQFYGGDCYIILYTYKQGSREQHIIYTWQGLKCTQDELAASAFLTVQLDDSMGGEPVQVRVTQGQEPPHLMSLFKKKPMIVHLGGTSRTGGQTKAGSTRLYHIRSSTTHATRAVEVGRASSQSLNSNDVFVLKTPNSLFVWRGIGASEEEVATSKHVVTFLGGSPVDVVEGKEPATFWTALGGKKEYQSSKSLQKMIKAPRLFGCSNKTGRLVVEEVPGDFGQVDLATDDVMLLDVGDQIFLWVGSQANEVEKTGAPKIAKEYVDTDPSGRSGIPITTIKQGAEPPIFTGWFHAWDVCMWEKSPLENI